MLPILFHIGNFPVRSYGLLIAIAFLIGIHIATKRTKGTSIPKEFISDLSVWIIIGAIVGARALHVIVYFDLYKDNLFGIINPIQADGSFGIAGLIVVGGLITSTLFFILYTKYKKFNILEVGDIIAPSTAIGIAIGRLGCFFNGCCWGKTTDSWIGVHFHGIPGQVIPTQLISVLDMVVLFFVVLFLEKKFKNFNGFTFFIFWILYFTHRFIIDFFRYYEKVEYHLFGLTHNQLIGLATISILSFFFIKNYTKNLPNKKK